MMTGLLFSCSKKPSNDTITVISREASSGTRAAFDELTGVSLKNGNNIQDNLFSEALISGSSGSVGMSVASEPNAIGYTSLATAGTAPKILSVDGIAPSMKNITDGTYPLQRPFLLVTNEEGRSHPIVKDFMNFLVSEEGRGSIVAAGYTVKTTKAEPFSPTPDLSGKIVLSGSTSTEPVMSKLQEVYKKLQPDVQLEIQFVGSTAGLKDLASGKAQIGLSSRDLTEEELQTLQAVPFAHDAIVIIVNKKNPLNDITTAQLKSIYTGEIRNWSALTADTAKSSS